MSARNTPPPYSVRAALSQTDIYAVPLLGVRGPAAARPSQRQLEIRLAELDEQFVEFLDQHTAVVVELTRLQQQVADLADAVSDAPTEELSTPARGMRMQGRHAAPPAGRSWDTWQWWRIRTWVIWVLISGAASAFAVLVATGGGMR